MSDDRDDLLLWLDLETTDTDETRDGICEVGAVLTDQNLVEWASFQSLCHPGDEGFGRLLGNPVVRAMHAKSGLLDELLLAPADLPKPHEVARSLLAWATDHGAEASRTVLCGSGVCHFDRRFLRRWMPQVEQFFRYWPIDVGVIRRTHHMWTGTGSPSHNELKTHRALDDARCHLAEARAFRDLWRGALVVPPVEVPEVYESQIEWIGKPPRQIEWIGKPPRQEKRTGSNPVECLPPESAGLVCYERGGPTWGLPGDGDERFGSGR